MPIRFSALAFMSIVFIACSDSSSSGTDLSGPDLASADAAPIGSDEPVFDPNAQTLVFADEFDYAGFPDAVAAGWRCTNGTTTQDTTSNPAGACRIIEGGSDGSGKAMRLVYDGVADASGQEGHSWSRAVGTPVGQPGHTLYMTFDFRISAGAGSMLDQDANHLAKVKWLMLYGLADRAQFSTGYQTCYNNIPFKADYGGTIWQFYGNGGGTTECNAGQVRPPFAYEGAGQWHRTTYKYVTQSLAGARDGVAQMWYDGVLILSVKKSDCGVAVPGAIAEAATGNGSHGPAVWCTDADLDEMFVQQFVDHLTLGSVLTNSLWAFSIDYDHMSVWRD